MPSFPSCIGLYLLRVSIEERSDDVDGECGEMHRATLATVSVRAALGELSPVGRGVVALGLLPFHLSTAAAALSLRLILGHLTSVLSQFPETENH